MFTKLNNYQENNQFIIIMLHISIVMLTVFLL